MNKQHEFFFISKWLLVLLLITINYKTKSPCSVCLFPSNSKATDSHAVFRHTYILMRFRFKIRLVKWMKRDANFHNVWNNTMWYLQRSSWLLSKQLERHLRRKVPDLHRQHYCWDIYFPLLASLNMSRVVFLSLSGNVITIK